MYLFRGAELFDLKTPPGRAFFDFFRATPEKNQKMLAHPPLSPPKAAKEGDAK